MRWFRLRWFEVWMVCIIHGQAQVLDDFSDGDFTTNPEWNGSISLFTIVSGQLRSNAGVSPLAIDYSLSTPSGRVLETQWEFFINLRFATSGSNFADVYLTCDQSTLTNSSLNGYFVRIGDTSDEIALYKSVNGMSTKLTSSPANTVNSTSNNPFRIKVTRNATSVWKLEYDDGDTGVYTAAPEVTDNTHTASSFFGIRIRQSTAASVANNHFFDDFYVGEIVGDNIPPVVQNLQVIQARELRVQFSEPINKGSAENPGNYQSLPFANAVSQAQLLTDGKTVSLIFHSDFPNGVEQTLTISNITDLAGNVLSATLLSYLYFQAFPVVGKDIILTEIFADPSPQIGLPSVEFIELHNRSIHPIDLGGWKLSDGSSVGTFASRILLPSAYLVVVASPNVSLFTSPTIGIPNFPTLNNSGDVLTLKTADDKLIDSVNYSLSWYRDEDKQEGGWSLELIDPANPCGEEDNWTASEDPKGGTPGMQNSVLANKPDVTGPRLLSAIAESPLTIQLTFNEKMDGSLVPDLFQLDPSLSVSQAVYTSDLRKIHLTLTSPLQPRTVYVLTASDLFDCNGNRLSSDFARAEVALTETADSLDILINEVLFNPFPGGVDFVEVYNASEKFINLKGWKMVRLEDGNILEEKSISQENLLLSPFHYRVFTSDPLLIQLHYPSHDALRFHTMTPPVLPDEEGTFALVSSESNIIDQFSYSEDLHHPLVKEAEGISLERISWKQPTQNKDNWNSASATSGFATPGIVNSQARPASVLHTNPIVVDPVIFSPQRSDQSFTTIQYQFDRGGFSANIKVMDAQGRVIKTIANNELLGTTGFFRWDGDTDSGSLARQGYYAVWAEVFDVDGSVRTFRQRIVIAQP